MKTLVYLAALGITVAAASAPAQAETYNGPYIGVQAGWDRGEISDSINSQPIVAEASRDSLVLAITDRVSARAEYRYSDFGNNGGQYDRHQTLVGLSFNF